MDELEEKRGVIFDLAFENASAKNEEEEEDGGKEEATNKVCVTFAHCSPSEPFTYKGGPK